MTIANEQERTYFITHKNHKVLVVDLSHCSAKELDKLARVVPVIVTAQPLKSVLVLSDFTGAQFDEEALRTIKETAVFDKPHIKKSAWIGAENFPHAFLEQLKDFSRRDFPIFKAREEALDWLVKD